MLVRCWLRTVCELLVRKEVFIAELNKLVVKQFEILVLDLRIKIVPVLVPRRMFSM